MGDRFKETTDLRRLSLKGEPSAVNQELEQKATTVHFKEKLPRPEAKALDTE